MNEKLIKRLHPAMRDDIGDLLTQRPLPGPHLQQIDPFLFLNHHGPQTYPPHNRGLPFGPHPHRGFETVTFVIDGLLMHKDSAGYESIIGPGGVQWMTAGRGIVHAEVSPPDFLREGGRLEILQLWVNLPAHLKMCEPAYTGVNREAIPALVSADGKTRVHLIAGQYQQATGPVNSQTGVFMSTVELAAGGRIRLDNLLDRNVFLSVVRGRVMVGPDLAEAFHLVELQEEGDALEIVADSDAMIVLGHAAPTNEPVVAHGPFVMNTREEIAAAISDYQAGRFGAPQAQP